tara:strand:+ start:2299 stop:3294 length:996 start_codon:yes stop_codon:yes gene_type:complete
MMNDCVVVYEDGEFNYFEPELNKKIFRAFQKYVNVIGCNPKLKVWYDLKDNVCFGSEQDFYSNPGEFSFFAREDGFLKKQNKYWGQEHINSYFGSTFDGENSIVSSEFVYHDHERFKDFENKKILIIGGGPSTIDVDWESIDYDHIWTCNNYFMNPILFEKEISLATLGPGVNLNDPRLVDSVKRGNTLCVFEGGVTPKRSEIELHDFKNQFPEQISYFHLRYFSKLGSAPRLVCFATFLGAKEVHFVGVDGHPVKQKHAFEGDAKKHTGAPVVPNSYNIHRRQTVLWWDYLLNYNSYPREKTKYQNLGEWHEANLTADISKQLFPLEIAL